MLEASSSDFLIELIQLVIDPSTRRSCCTVILFKWTANRADRPDRFLIVKNSAAVLAVLPKRGPHMFKPVFTACPADVTLDPAPFPREWVLDGSPQAHAKELARSRDGAMTVVAWSCTKGRFRWQYLVDEMVHVLSGEVTIVDHTQTERRLGPGDTAFFPAGSWSTWHVTQDVRKVAVCRVAVPKLVALALRIWNRIYGTVGTALGAAPGRPPLMSA
jgi:uncharacterized cupin superfamily protein